MSYYKVIKHKFLYISIIIIIISTSIIYIFIQSISCISYDNIKSNVFDINYHKNLKSIWYNNYTLPLYSSQYSTFYKNNLFLNKKSKKIEYNNSSSVVYYGNSMTHSPWYITNVSSYPNLNIIFCPIPKNGLSSS